MKKTVWIPSFLLALILALTACGETAEAPAEEPREPAPAAESNVVGAVTYSNDGLSLPVPAEFESLLDVKTPESSEDGTLFTVSEKASMEWGEKLHPGEDWGDGWLFSIGRIDEDALHDMLCYDMSGAVPFASDTEGNYYVFYHPTDVRFVRESYDIDPESEDWKQWSALNEWAWEVQGAFAAENDDVTLRSFTNTDVDRLLNQLAYLEEEPYTLSCPSFGTLEPGSVDKEPFLDRLLDGVSFTMTDGEAVPDGEYIVLDLPQAGEELDFFLGDGNLVREIYDGEETLYRASYENGETVAADVMQAWYDALAEDAAVG